MQTNEENAQEEKSPEQILREKFEAIDADLQALSEKYGMDILVGANLNSEKQAAVLYKGSESFVIQAGLAKLIEQKFIQ
jgi:hypothetical protein